MILHFCASSKRPQPPLWTRWQLVGERHAPRPGSYLTCLILSLQTEFKSRSVIMTHSLLIGEGIPDITDNQLDGLPQSITYRVLQGSMVTMWFLSVENFSPIRWTSFYTLLTGNGFWKIAYAMKFVLVVKRQYLISNDRYNGFWCRSLLLLTHGCRRTNGGRINIWGWMDLYGWVLQKKRLISYENNQIHLDSLRMTD